MPTHKLRRFSDPGVLRTMSAGSLRRLLEPHEAFLAEAGLPLPGRGERFHPDHERLAELFVTADEGVPGELVEALYHVDEMADLEGMDLLLTAMADLEPSLFDWTPADVAALAWRHDRPTFERVLAQRSARCRSRSFVACRAAGGAFEAAIVGSALEALEREIDEAFRARGRGTGTRVIVSPREDGNWYLVRHGEPMRREPCLHDGRSGSVFYRPERHDVVVVDAAAGELRISAAGRWQRDLYRRLFGRFLARDEAFFRGDEKYTLAPLFGSGRRSLLCPEVWEIEHIALTHLEYFEPGPLPLGTAKSAEDLFTSLEEGAWELPEDAVPTSAQFRVKLRGVRPRMVTITPPNVARYTADDEARHVEAWLAWRGFLIGGGSEEGRHGPVLACA